MVDLWSVNCINPIFSKLVVVVIVIVVVVVVIQKVVTVVVVVVVVELLLLMLLFMLSNFVVIHLFSVTCNCLKIYKWFTYDDKSQLNR